MRIGINGTGLVRHASIDRIVQDASHAQKNGFSSYWLAEHPTGGFDALSALLVTGTQVPTIELGTAIIPTWPRHPMALAGQAQTTHDGIGHRLTLGIGLSHESMMAELGIGFDKPIGHLKDYLSILVALLETGQVDYQGRYLSTTARAFQTPQKSCPVLVAALGPQALAVAGRLAQGTSLAWVGPKTVREHIKPRINDAAAAAGKDAPRIVATLPICVTDNEARVREHISKTLSMYAQLPSYQAMFEREGVSTPGELGLVGSAQKVQDALAQLAEAGVTDYAASQYVTNPQEAEATHAVLVEFARTA